MNDPNDGTAPEGEAGSVTKVATKKGHGIGETVMAVANEVAPDVAGLVADAKDAHDAIKEHVEPASVGCACIIA